jgi:hypothetical protein
MIEPEGGTEKETESASSDWMGALKFAGVVVIGLLAIVGLGWEDLMGFNQKAKPKSEAKSETESKKKSDEEPEGVADYEETYLEGSLEESDYEDVPSK